MILIFSNQGSRDEKDNEQRKRDVDSKSINTLEIGYNPTLKVGVREYWRWWMRRACRKV